MTLTVSNSGGGGMGIAFPTQPGYGYQAEYKTNLTDAVWIPLSGRDFRRWHNPIGA